MSLNRRCLQLSGIILQLTLALNSFAGHELPSSLSHLLEDPSLTAVTREFGPSIISLRNLPFRSEVASADRTPWSGWWFPKRDATLFQDVEAPLRKYDTYRALIYRERGLLPPPSASQFEVENHNPSALPWEGLCDAWSLAAVAMPEPKNPVTLTRDGVEITFSVFDLKALLLKTFEAIDECDLKYYGQKFTGDHNGWVYPDIFPNEFHRYLEVKLFEKREAFVMDRDAGVAVWNVPVYKSNYVIKEIPDDPNAVLVTAWVYTAEVVPLSQKEFTGTREVVRTYHYKLTGVRDQNENLRVTSGEWIKGSDGVNSIKDHPDFITAIRDDVTLKRKSYNPEIEIALIDEILAQSY